MLFDVHTHFSGCVDYVALHNYSYGGDGVELVEPFSVGVHPWNSCGDVDWGGFELLAESALAVGECGLDKVCGVDMAVQEAVFVRQIEIAKRLRKPIVVHCVRCYGRLLELIKREGVDVPVVLHGYYGPVEMIRSFVGIGAYVSIGRVQLGFKRGADLVRAVPLDRLFLETDESTATIREVYALASGLLGCELSELELAVEVNCMRVFGGRLT